MRTADHIEYWLDLIGPSHIGIGLDYFFEVDVGAGFNDVLAANAGYWPKSQYSDGAVECAAPAELIAVADPHAAFIPGAVIHAPAPRGVPRPSDPSITHPAVAPSPAPA